MGKSKQQKTKLNYDKHGHIEISSPILDPEIIKAIHTPPDKRQGMLSRHKAGGFRALFADSNSQEVPDETQIDFSHVPSYISLSCAISGYTNYSPYSRCPRSRTTSPSVDRATNAAGESVANNNINDNGIHTSHKITTIEQGDDMSKQYLVTKQSLNPVASERTRSPSPRNTTEDDRHHGTISQARYCLLPPPSKQPTKHIPLLGIDDDLDEAQLEKEDSDSKKVEKRIASLYGEQFADGWRESMTQKQRKESAEHGATISEQESDRQQTPDLSIGQHSLNRYSLHHEIPSLQGIRDSSTSPEARLIVSTDKAGSSQETTPIAVDLNRPAVSKDSPEARIIVSTDMAGSHQEETPISVDLNRSESPENSHEARVIVSTDMAGSHQETTPITVDEDRAASLKDSPEAQIIVSTDMTGNHQETTPITGEINRPTSSGVAPDEGSVVESLISDIDERDGRHFLEQLESEAKRIKDHVRRAEEILSSEGEASRLDDDTLGRIHSSIGKANLLLSKKFKQFKELCDDNLAKSKDEKFATLNGDLEGFWDLVTIQINDVNESFEALWRAQADNWTFDAEITETKPENRQAKSGIPKANKTKLNAQKDQERRIKLQEHIHQMKMKEAASSVQTIQEEDLLGTDDDVLGAFVSESKQEGENVQGPSESLMD